MNKLKGRILLVCGATLFVLALIYVNTYVELFLQVVSFGAIISNLGRTELVIMLSVKTIHFTATILSFIYARKYLRAGN